MSYARLTADDVLSSPREHIRIIAAALLCCDDIADLREEEQMAVLIIALGRPGLDHALLIDKSDDYIRAMFRGAFTDWKDESLSAAVEAQLKKPSFRELCAGRLPTDRAPVGAADRSAGPDVPTVPASTAEEVIPVDLDELARLIEEMEQEQ